MRLFFLLVVLGVGAGVAAGFLLSGPEDLDAQLAPAPSVAKEVASGTDRGEVVSPPPLRAGQDAPGAFLTNEGTFTWTNAQRAEYGLVRLTENEMLNRAAEAKLQDMFVRQFFAHVAPDGVGAGDLVAAQRYRFILVGENLALGNFEDDKTLVQAWMDSPGHRANILNEHYREIGVAVGKGSFEGQDTWLAVQIFGLPSSFCPEPSKEAKSVIDQNQGELAGLGADLTVRKAQLEAAVPKRGAEYNAKVQEYNELVAEYNLLVQRTKTLVAEYNGQAEAFNACVQGLQG